jgi:hypothetical protein
VDEIYKYSPLFLEAIDATGPPYTGGGTKNWGLYLHSPGIPSGTSYWSLFLNSDTTTVDYMPLYTYGHASGSPPHGREVVGSVGLFLANIADRRRYGAIPLEDYWTLFLRGDIGWFDSINLFISGHPIPGTGNATSGDMFIRGHTTPNNQIPLRIFGISGLIHNGPNGVPLFIHATSGVYNTEVILYTHGY